MAEKKFPDWATSLISDIGNGDPNIVEPGSPKKASGWGIEKPLLQFMNWIQSLQSHFIRANNEVKIKADNYEAEAGEIVVMNNASGPVTGKLPASPVDGQWVVFGGKASFSIQGVTVSGNGKDIMVTGDQSVDLNMDNRLFIFYWREAESVWKINIWAVMGEVSI